MLLGNVTGHMSAFVPYRVDNYEVNERIHLLYGHLFGDHFTLQWFFFLYISLYLLVNSFVVVELLRRNSIYIFGWHGGHTNLFFDVLALLVSAAVLGQIQHKDSELRFHRPVPLVGYSTVQQEHSTPFLVQRHTIKFVMWFDATDGGLVSICSFLLLYS